MSVQFFNGYTLYGDIDVTDRQICDLVGLDTYKSLFTLFPTLYSDFTYPMTPSSHRLQEVKNLLSVHEELLPSDLKKYLVIRHVDGPNSLNSQIVNGFVDSSEKMIIPQIRETTLALWILVVLFVTILIVYVIIFHVWPSLREYRIMWAQKYGSPVDWLETPWG
jgi:hypothetical protein